MVIDVGFLLESFSAVADSGKRRKKQKHSLSFSVSPTKTPAGVRQKWFPSMYVARPAPLIGYLVFFPEALGAASRALS